MQHYFGSVAKDLLADADAAFSKLPPPKPSRKGCGVASGAAMARAYNYRGNGCVAGDSLARLFDGTSKRVADVVKGDILVDALTRGPAVVRCVVRTRMLDPALRRRRRPRDGVAPVHGAGRRPVELPRRSHDARRRSRRGLRLQFSVRRQSDRLPLGRWDGGHRPRPRHPQRLGGFSPVLRNSPRDRRAQGLSRASPRDASTYWTAPTCALPEIATSRRSIRTASSGRRRGPSPP